MFLGFKIALNKRHLSSQSIVNHIYLFYLEQQQQKKIIVIVTEFGYKNIVFNIFQPNVKNKLINMWRLNVCCQFFSPA